MSPAICFNLDQSKILSSSNGLNLFNNLLDSLADLFSGNLTISHAVLQFAHHMKKLLRNIVGSGENDNNLYCLLFPECFLSLQILIF